MDVFLYLLSFVVVVFTAKINMQNRIMEGTEITPNEFSFMAFIMGSKICGGSIIREDVVLTAASCVRRNQAHLSIGNEHFFHNPRVPQIFSKNIIHHPKWDNASVNNIALIILPKPIIFDDKLRAIQFHKDSSSFKQVIVTGWGNLKGFDLTLKRGDYRILDKDACLCSNSPLFEDNLCMRSEDPSVLTNNDAGGPVVARHGDQYVQIGLLNDIIEECNSANLNVATDIANYIEWIEENMPAPETAVARQK